MFPNFYNKCISDEDVDNSQVIVEVIWRNQEQALVNSINNVEMMELLQEDQEVILDEVGNVFDIAEAFANSGNVWVYLKWTWQGLGKHTLLVCRAACDWKNQLRQASPSPKLQIRGLNPVLVSVYVCVNVTKDKGESKTGNQAGDSLTSKAS